MAHSLRKSRREVNVLPGINRGSPVFSSVTKLVTYLEGLPSSNQRPCPYLGPVSRDHFITPPAEPWTGADRYRDPARRPDYAVELGKRATTLVQ